MKFVTTIESATDWNL